MGRGFWYWVTVGWLWESIKWMGRVGLWLFAFPLGLWRSWRHGRNADLNRTRRTTRDAAHRRRAA